MAELSASKPLPDQERPNTGRLVPRRILDVGDLMETVKTLRAPGGSPWNAAQTPQSLRTLLLEESYELAEALDRDDISNIREELGDLLLHIVFQCLMAEEMGRFSFEEVVQGVVDKLRRRHAEVFDPGESDSDESQVWFREKWAEKGFACVTDEMASVVRILPPSIRAMKLQNKALRAGWPGGSEQAAKELYQKNSQHLPAEAQSEEVWHSWAQASLFDLINYLRSKGFHAHDLLYEANEGFLQTFALYEAYLKAAAQERRQSLSEVYGDQDLCQTCWQKAQAYVLSLDSVQESENKADESERNNADAP